MEQYSHRGDNWSYAIWRKSRVIYTNNTFGFDRNTDHDSKRYIDSNPTPNHYGNRFAQPNCYCISDDKRCNAYSVANNNRHICTHCNGDIYPFANAHTDPYININPLHYDRRIGGNIDERESVKTTHFPRTVRGCCNDSAQFPRF